MEEILPKFSELAENKVLDGDKVTINEVLNKLIVITGYHVSASKYKKKGNEICLKIQFYYFDDTRKERKVVFSGSSVVKDQLEEIDDKLKTSGKPFEFSATLKKIGNYYSLT